ncbi:hypothetical protein V2J09_017164 [Rumex salicifolius]
MSVSRVYDPSQLHLKKELTQIRKAARVLRDPGTSSSWRSPLSSTRSAAAALSALNASGVRKTPSFHFELQNATKSAANNKEGGREEEKKVFLYNWRSKNNKSSSEKSLVRVDLDDGNHNNEVDGSSSFPGSVPSSGASVDDCLSDARNGGGRAADSKSDTYVDEFLHLHSHGDGCRPPRRDHNQTTGIRRRDTRLASMASPATMRRAMGKMKIRKTSSSLMHKQRRNKLQQLVPSRRSMNSKLALKGVTPCNSIGLSQDSASLIEQSDDTEKYYNSEDLGHSSATSPLLSRVMQMNFPQSSNKILRGGRRGDSSYTYSTPALSASSFNRYFNNRIPSNVESWDGTTVSLNEVDGEAEDALDLPGQQGCGIPCWSRRSTPKHKGGYGSCSPSLSDALRRKGSRLICGTQIAHHNRHRSLSCIGKQRIVSGTVQGRIPLLNSCDAGASSFGTGNSDDELSTNFGELDLEGLSRLDGRRWSASCRSQEGLEPMALAGDSQDESMLETVRSFGQRYRPVFFDALVGQHIVVQSLMNAITRGRIAPLYLFQGPRGTGKTTTAKIFAASLNCLATDEMKPCGVCRECANSFSSKSRNIIEVDGTNKKRIDSVRYLLKRLAVAPPSATSSYKVFVIDECHLLSSKTWAALLKFLEQPLPKVVFIFITTDLENVPHTILSRCQKHLFNKIKDVDIVTRLQRIAAEENLEVEPDALDLIALNADGSLRDAETMLEQLSLLGKRITSTLVNELVGIVSDEKLLELLELAISSNTAETVKRSRELLDSGADPLVLMPQLASLIMDIIAGNYLLDGGKHCNSFVGRMSEVELEKLKHALKLLSEAEKQLRVSSERSTWFTATLLQLGSVTSPEFTLSGSSRKQSSKTTDEEQSTASRDGPGLVQKSDAHYVSRRLASLATLPNSCHQEASFLLKDGISSNSKASHSKSRHSVDTTASHEDMVVEQILSSKLDAGKLDNLWLQCIGRCHYEKLRQLLQNYGKLVSVSEIDGVLLTYIAFGDEKIKSRADRYLISITNSFETVLKRSVEVRIIVLPDGLIPIDNKEAVMPPHSTGCKMEPINKDENLASLNNSPLLDERSLAIKGNDKAGSTRERRQELPMQKIETIIREQRLETAWLQAVEKGTPSSTSRLRPERNQVLPQDGASLPQNQLEAMSSIDLTSHRWDDERNLEVKPLKINDKKIVEKDQIGTRAELPPISPSLLHQSSCGGNLSKKDHQGYESGPGGKGCNILFCWNTRHPRRAKGTTVQQRKGENFLCFGECRKKSRI